jgi:hypothetical protein
MANLAVQMPGTTAPYWDAVVALGVGPDKPVTNCWRP